MIDNDSSNESNAEGLHGEKLGVTLQRAREFKGLTVDDVAHRLNLSQQRIYDMEGDDYRFAGAETYAKGYLRSYAKFLGLDPDLIVHEFDRLHYSETIERHETKLLSKRQFSSGDRWMRWVTYSIGMILIFLVAIWWRSQPSQPNTTTIATESTGHTTTDITTQATQKTESTATSATPTTTTNEAQTDSANLLPKSDSQPITLESTISQANSQQATTVTPQPSTNGQPTSADSTQTPNSTTNQNTATTDKISSNKNDTKPAVSTPATSNVDSDDSEDDDSEDEDTETSATNSAITKKQSWYQIKPFKPRVLVGQRGHDERVLLQELEKAFGRG